jgi:parallel beta-helix repeat protein
MGLRNILLSGGNNAPKALKRACRLGALAALVLGFAPGRAAAQCPGNITANYSLSGNLTATTADPNPCITVGADNVTVNLAGFTLNVSAQGDAAVAIETGISNNATIVGGGGTIITAYSSGAATAAIDSKGGSNVTVTGVTLANEPGATLCSTNARTNTNWGTGISLNAVTGGNLSANIVSCYQTGISVQNSSIPRRGTGTISGNDLEGNTFDMFGSGQGGVYSAGLVLTNSSGWTVDGNTIDYNGSEDTNQGCTSNGTTVISCAFGLQIINGSSSNSITNNTVNTNFIGGIYTGPATSKNSIIGNTATNNGLYDLYDDSPGHGNAWRKNTCYTAGGSVSPQKCP